jgi:hypothetical protein
LQLYSHPLVFLGRSILPKGLLSVSVGAKSNLGKGNLGYYAHA